MSRVAYLTILPHTIACSCRLYLVSLSVDMFRWARSTRFIERGDPTNGCFLRNPSPHPLIDNPLYIRIGSGEGYGVLHNSTQQVIEMMCVLVESCVAPFLESAANRNVLWLMEP